MSEEADHKQLEGISAELQRIKAKVEAEMPIEKSIGLLLEAFALTFKSMEIVLTRVSKQQTNKKEEDNQTHEKNRPS